MSLQEREERLNQQLIHEIRKARQEERRQTKDSFYSPR